MYLMGFSAKKAVGLANSLIVMTSFVKYSMSWFKSQPGVSFKNIVDYNCAIIMIPPMVLFSSLGGIIGAMLPDLIVSVTMILVLLYPIITGYLNLRKELKQRRE